MASEEVIIKAIGVLGEAFRQKVTEQTVQAYMMGCDDMTDEALLAATKESIKTCKFMPAPAELRQLGGELTADDSALMAWATVEKATALGSYKHVDFEDRLINGAIRMLGGWPALLSRPQKDFDVWVRKEFLATYSALKRSKAGGEVCASLPGLSESGEVHHVSGHIEVWEPPVVEVSTIEHRAPSRPEQPQPLLSERSRPVPRPEPSEKERATQANLGRSGGCAD